MHTLVAAIWLTAGLGLPASAHAAGVETRSYQTVERMGNVLVEARQDMDTALFNITVRQQQIERAAEERDAAQAAYGSESRDAAVTQARYDQIKQEALGEILHQLSVMAPRFEEAEGANRDQVRRILQTPSNFEALVKGHLRGEHNPAVMSVLVFLATRRLNLYCQELYAKTLMGKVDLDIQEVRRSIELVDALLDPQISSTSIDEAWSLLSSEWAVTTDPDAAMDDLDRLLADH